MSAKNSYFLTHERSREMGLQQNNYIAQDLPRAAELFRLQEIPFVGLLAFWTLSIVYSFKNNSFRKFEVFPSSC
jgi:hypothetical protein